MMGGAGPAEEALPLDNDSSERSMYRYLFMEWLLPRTVDERGSCAHDNVTRIEH